MAKKEDNLKPCEYKLSQEEAKSDGITDVTSLHGEFIENSKLRAEVEAKLG